MKFVISFIVVAMLCGALASPLVELPSTRLITVTASNNFTITTNAHCATQQNTGSAALATAMMSPNYYQHVDAFSVMTLNQGVVYSQLALCGTYLTTYIGKPTGITAVSGSMTTVINSLTQSCMQLATIDPTAAAAMNIKIQLLVTLQTSINTNMNSCAGALAMYYTCSDSLYTSICQFWYQAAIIMCTIEVTFSNDVINGVTTTSTSTSTTTGTPTTVSITYFIT